MVRTLDPLGEDTSLAGPRTLGIRPAVPSYFLKTEMSEVEGRNYSKENGENQWTAKINKNTNTIQCIQHSIIYV